ncbi:magnesium transporter, partial [candidate division WOR-3 bacterium]|nr:magnesium transporter [candidate division WOR-3 bacterium]
MIKKSKRKKPVKRRRKRRKRKLNIALQILIQSLPILLITSIGEVIAGSVLGKMSTALAVVPGLIILIPAVMDLRGNIGTALGSRVSTMLHLGILGKHFSFNRIIGHNVGASASLTAAVALILGIVAHFISVLFGLPSIGPVHLLLIAFLAALLAQVFLQPFTLFLTFASFNKNLDPDNIVAPLLGMLGDVVSIVSIFIASIIVRRIPFEENWFLTLSILSFIILVKVRTKKKRKRKRKRRETFPLRYRFKSIVKQSIGVLYLCGILGVFSGLILHYKEKSLMLIPGLLILVPQVIAKSGSIGGIFGARFSSGMHLGFFTPFRINRYLMEHLLAACGFWIAISPVAAYVTYIGALVTGVAIPSLLTLVYITG